MNYSYNYRNNPSFPYNKRKISKKSNTFKEPEKEQKENITQNKKEQSSFLDSSFIQSILSPIEKLIGRKINFDDILLLALIYIIFTEKEENNDSKTLLLCLLFILIG